MRHIQLHKYIRPFLGRGLGVGSLFLLCSLITSCEFFDIDEIGVETAAKITLSQDTIYVMQGDTFSINPVFMPDTINITDLFLLPERGDVVEVCGVDKMAAVGEGGTKVYITSVSARILDSCMVYVSPRWEVEQRVWPYETVFYANVTLDGKPLTEDMEVAAFIGSKCRAVGQLKMAHGISYLQLRVGSDWYLIDDSDINWDDGEEGEYDAEGLTGDNQRRPVIRFRCYDHAHRWLYTTSQYEIFDGETHGTLSDLYEIAF